MIKILLFAVIALLLIWVFLRIKAGKTPTAPADRPAKALPEGKFHAVSIRFSERACSAAKSRAGERYLASDSPELPLKECDADRCECYFAHYKDRRSGHDRRSPFNPATGPSGTGVHEIERRQSGGRRQDD